MIIRGRHIATAVLSALALLYVGYCDHLPPWMPQKVVRRATGLSIPQGSELRVFRGSGYTTMSASSGMYIELALSPKALARVSQEANTLGFGALPPQSDSNSVTLRKVAGPEMRGWFKLEKQGRSAFRLVIIDAAGSRIIYESITG